MRALFGAHVGGPSGHTGPVARMGLNVSDVAMATAVLIVVWVIGLHVGPWGDTRITDVPVFQGYAERMHAGEFPYRDFAFEYPPLAALLFWLTGVFGTSWHAYSAAFGDMMLLTGIVCLVLVALIADQAGLKRRWLAPALFAALPLLLGAVVRTHFDLVPATLVMGAIFLLFRGREVPAFALLGIGAMVKIYPALLVPAAVAYIWGIGRHRESLRGLFAFVGVVVAVSMPFVALDPAGYADAYRFQINRPVQIESTPASVLVGLNKLGVTSIEVTGTVENPDSYKSQGLSSSAAGPVTGLSSAVAAMIVALVSLMLAGSTRKAPDRIGFLLAVIASLVAVVVLGKVLSPQFLIWLVPAATLVAACGYVRVASAVGVACLLTLVEFPAMYDGLVSLHKEPVLIVAARNLSLLVALAMVLAAVASRSRVAKTSSSS